MRRLNATVISNVILPTLLVASFGLFMTAVVHRLTADDNAAAGREASAHAAREIEGSFDVPIAVVHSIHAFWLGSTEVTNDDFNAYAEELRKDYPDLVALEWVDANNVVRYVHPADGPNANVIDFDNNLYPNRLKPILDAKESREPVMTRPIFLAQGFPGVVIYDPIFRGDEYLGSAVVVTSLDTTLERLRTSPASSEHRLVVESDGVFMRPEYDAIFMDGKRVTAPDGTGVTDDRAPLQPTGFASLASSVIVASRPWSVIALPTAARSPLTAALGIITVGMAALCGLFFAALHRTRRKLERTIARERDFTSLVSHQLRAPLTELNWMTDVLAESDTDPATRAATIRDMRMIVRQGVKTVNALLSISRIERGVLQVKREDVPVATIVDDAVASLREQARAKGITFNIDVAAEHAARVDLTHAVEALRNIVDNAVKYGPDKRPVSVVSREDGDFIVIDVADHGPGVPEHVAATMFEKATASQKRTSTDGAGLGLFLTKMLAELMGGSVTMRTKPGSTVFSLRLPRPTDGS